jgi:hypothetical protein
MLCLIMKSSYFARVSIPKIIFIYLFSYRSHLVDAHCAEHQIYWTIILAEVLTADPDAIYHWLARFH